MGNYIKFVQGGISEEGVYEKGLRYLNWVD